MHMKFQVNILCSSGIMRGDRQTDRPTDRQTDRQTDRPTDRPTLWNVGIRGESKNLSHFQKSISRERLMIEKRLTTQIKEERLYFYVIVIKSNYFRDFD